jgi:hypothetical protein
MELDEARGHVGEILIHRFLDKQPEMAELVGVGAHALYVRLEGTTEVVSMHPRYFTLREHPVLLPELRWAPYQEFGIPDPAWETSEPPSGPITIGATGYRGRDIIIYWKAV